MLCVRVRVDEDVACACGLLLFVVCCLLLASLAACCLLLACEHCTRTIRTVAYRYRYLQSVPTDRTHIAWATDSTYSRLPPTDSTCTDSNRQYVQYVKYGTRTYNT